MKGLKIEEVAVKVGVSVQTLNRWYKFKRDNPEDSTSKLLPSYKMCKTKITGLPLRLWQEKDINKLIDFKNNVTKGRDGKMGKYKGRGTSNAEKKSRRKTKPK